MSVSGTLRNSNWVREWNFSLCILPYPEVLSTYYEEDFVHCKGLEWPKMYHTKWEDIEKE